MAETREGRPGLPLRSACDTAPIFLHTIDRDGTILASQDGRTGENVFDRAPQEHQAELRAILRRVFESRESGSIEGPNGESGWLSGRYAPLVDGDRTVAAVVMLWEASPTSRTSAAIREGERRFHVLADGAPLVIWRTDENGRVNYVNAEFVRFAGVPAEEILGDGWANLLHEDDRDHHVADWLDATERRRMFSREARFRTGDGRYRLLFVNGNPVFRPDGAFEGHVGTCVDMTDIRHAQEMEELLRNELASSSRVATLDELTTGLAHELHQPLAAISVATGAALRELASGTPSRERLSEMILEARDQALRAGTLLETMRNFIRRLPGHHRAVDVGDLVHTSIGLVRREAVQRNVSVAVDLAPEPLRVLGDRVQLQQVLVNLLQNAFLAMQDVPKESRTLSIQTRSEGPQRIGILVRDCGTGLSPEVRERMFDVFFTTRPDGLGMGLAISRSIVEAHHGTLSGENAPGGGAVFHVALPGSVAARLAPPDTPHDATHDARAS